MSTEPTLSGKSARLSAANTTRQLGQSRRFDLTETWVFYTELAERLMPEAAMRGVSIDFTFDDNTEINYSERDRMRRDFMRKVFDALEHRRDGDRMMVNISSELVLTIDEQPVLLPS